MTAEELFEKHFNKQYMNITEEMIQSYAKEYTRIKCQELLEIVAEKAKMSETYYNHVVSGYCRATRELLIFNSKL